MTYLEENIDDYPDKYFKVPPSEEMDTYAHDLLIGRIEVLNELMGDITDGCKVDATDRLIATFSHIIGSMLYQANQIRKAVKK